jgi:hypothetical protein
VFYQDGVARHLYVDCIRRCSVEGRAGSRTRIQSRGSSFRAHIPACGLQGASFCKALDLAITFVRIGQV